jgi:hypothetical protein
MPKLSAKRKKWWKDAVQPLAKALCPQAYPPIQWVTGLLFRPQSQQQGLNVRREMPPAEPAKRGRDTSSGGATQQKSDP